MATPPPPSHDRRHNQPLPPPVTSHERSRRHDNQPLPPQPHSHEHNRRYHDKQPETPHGYSHDRRHDKQPETPHGYSHDRRHDKQPATPHGHSHDRRHDKQPLPPHAHSHDRRHDKQPATPHGHSHDHRHDKQPLPPHAHSHDRRHDKQSATPHAHSHDRRHDKQSATPLQPPSHDHDRRHHNKQPATPYPHSHERHRRDKQPAPAPSNERHRHDKQPAPAPSHERHRHDKQPATPYPHSHERHRHDKQPVTPVPSHERHRHDKQPAPAPSHERHRHDVHRATTIVNHIYRCSGCKMEGWGERYLCTSKSCDYRLHVDCWKKTPRTLTLDQFPGSTFELLDGPPPTRPSECGCSRSRRVCDVCGENVLGLVYHCKKSDSDVHPLCANVAKHRAIPLCGVEFKLSGKKDDAKTVKCILCNKWKLKGSAGNVPGLRYVSSSKNPFLDLCGIESRYGFHVSCLMRTAFDFHPDHSLPEQKQLMKDSGYAQFAKLVDSMLSFFLPMIFGDPTLVAASIGFTSFIIDQIWAHHLNKKKKKQILGILK